MKIQHNIPAMNAYRNYTNNVSAVAKNLEKLSSGYRINRAGDDAAGLAISEKMRAQITGLATAQKNAKDGISLIQTAEGALTEVHSMLNRMFELAEQSANGTYDNEVDRANLQKEFDALRSEIDRIADSSNFNGQKLLDGTLDGTKASTTSTMLDEANYNAKSPITESIGKLQGDLGIKTILQGSPVTQAKTEFSVALNDLKFTGAADDKITIKIGSDEFTVTSGATELDAKGIAGLFKTAIDGQNIGGQKFDVTVVDNVLTFKQNAMPGTDSEVVEPSMQVSITVESATTNEADVTALVDDAVLNSKTGNIADFTNLNADNILAAAEAAGAVGPSVAVTIKHNPGGKDGQQIELLAGDKVIGYASEAGAAVANGSPGELKFIGLDGTALGSVDLTAGHTSDGIALADFTTAVDSGIKLTIGAPVSVNGTYNTGTTVITQGATAAGGNLASTTFTLDANMVKDGAFVELGGVKYAFKTTADSALDSNSSDYTVIDLTGVAEEDLIEVAAEKLTEAAADNKVWDVGHSMGDKGKITLTQKDSIKLVTPMRDLPSIQEQVKTGTLADTTIVKAGEGSALTLQIGDTADEYNMLQVNVSDMHAEALGIGKSININEQGMSQTAMDAIKNAINMVSSTRGDLGALQNRLEHTINNLGVMEENIQDAEASIRDTDVAKEMMAYTKNNILVQASQAMLAQANQLPQGVLQLLG